MSKHLIHNCVYANGVKRACHVATHTHTRQYVQRTVFGIFPGISFSNATIGKVRQKSAILFPYANVFYSLAIT